MIVLCISNCPPGLRGDLSKWLSEVNTGVYIGKLSAKVRDELWKRVCGSIRSGQATMVYSTNNEQGYAFQTHNTTWIATDYEGITLMKRPLLSDRDSANDSPIRPGFSKASKFKKQGTASKNRASDTYVVMNIKTTGADYERDRIFEVGLLRICGDEIGDQLQCLLQCGRDIPETVTKLTGISDEMIEREGIREKEALDRIQKFIGDDLVVGYNVQIDMKFIQRLGERLGKQILIANVRDVLQLVRRKVDDLENFQMETVAAYFSLDVGDVHGALTDCGLIYRIYLELNKL